MVFPSFDLTGQVALVTGAARGLGITQEQVYSCGLMDSTNSIYAVPVKEAAGALQFGAPQTLANWSAPDPWYQVSPEGKKILLYRVSQQVSDSVTVVTNFSSILKK